MKTILSIGEFSKINAISIQTLRFYDQIGLLKPYKIDPHSKYRFYHINQSSLVDAIQYLRQLGFSLEEVKEILSDKQSHHLQDLIEDKRQALLAEKRKLEEQIKEIEVFQSGAKLYHQAKRQKKVEILSFPQREILLFEIDRNIYQMSTEEYEFYLRYFKQAIHAHNPYYHHLSRVGSLMAAEDFQEKNWVSKHFLLFQHETIHLPNTSIQSLAAGEYAVAYSVSFEAEIDALPHFHQAIHEAGYQPCGPYICEVIHEQPQLQENQRDMFIRMQVQVKKRDS